MRALAGSCQQSGGVQVSKKFTCMASIAFASPRHTRGQGCMRCCTSCSITCTVKTGQGWTAELDSPESPDMTSLAMRQASLSDVLKPCHTAGYIDA